MTDVQQLALRLYRRRAQFVKEMFHDNGKAAVVQFVHEADGGKRQRQTS